MLGVYSSITLDTERRQKEVAIRKVNGAGMSHIIWLFARLYIPLLMVTAALSFPLVYLVLQLGKQIYTVFFNCGFWFWTGIFISVAMITEMCIRDSNTRISFCQASISFRSSTEWMFSSRRYRRFKLMRHLIDKLIFYDGQFLLPHDNPNRNDKYKQQTKNAKAGS